MKKIVLAMTTAAALCAGVPLSTTTVAAQDVDIRVGGPRGPGVVIDTDARRYRDRDCRSVTVTEWRHGVRVTRTERHCD
jgi:accessory colonization factor AcfC